MKRVAVGLVLVAAVGACGGGGSSASSQSSDDSSVSRRNSGVQSNVESRKNSMSISEASGHDTREEQARADALVGADVLASDLSDAAKLFDARYRSFNVSNAGELAGWIADYLDSTKAAEQELALLPVTGASVKTAERELAALTALIRAAGIACLPEMVQAFGSTQVEACLDASGELVGASRPAVAGLEALRDSL